MSFHFMWLLLNFPLYDPATYASTMNLQRLVLENVTFPPENVQLSPWISLRELVITWSRVNLDEISILAPNLRRLSVHQNESINRTHNRPLWQEFDYLAFESHMMDRLRWSECLVRELDVHTHLSPPHSPSGMQSLINFIDECKPLILSSAFCPSAGLDFWRTLRSICPDLRCLTFTLVSRSADYPSIAVLVNVTSFFAVLLTHHKSLNFGSYRYACSNFCLNYR